MRLIGLVILAFSLILAPLAAEAQRSGRIPRIGYLSNGNPAKVSTEREAFRRGLRELGWVEGQNVTIEYRWAEGNPDRFPALVAEFVQLKVDVIVLSGPPALHAARRATSTIPVVFVVLADPIAAGLVTSLARPGGNLTGLASQFEELITKQLQLLKEAVPTVSRVALLHHRESWPAVVSAAETAARSLALAARTLEVEGVEFENAFRTARREPVGAIHVLPSPIFYAHRGRLIELAARYRLPAVYELKPFVEDGGLISYGPNINEMFRRQASYVDRILKGAKAGDLPIERPTTFEPDDPALPAAAGGSGDRVTVQAFYDRLAPLYHLVYEDWEASVGRQGEMLASLIAEHWGPGAHTVLDAALGIGTQALGLLANGFGVTGSDISVGAVARARREAAVRRFPLVSLIADFRTLPVRSSSFDVVLVCDNSPPHLDTVEDIRTALAECFRCVRPGGGCLIAGAGFEPATFGL